MTIKLHVTVRNAMLDAYEYSIGTSPTLSIYSGTIPADLATAPSGTELVSLTLPSDWAASAASGSKPKQGGWTGSASASGTAAFYRILSGINAMEQGTIGATGSGADLTVADPALVTGQTITVTTKTLVAGNAG